MNQPAPNQPAVLFVCLGNICRSPSAEAVFRSYLAERGLSQRVRVDSAGTGAWHTGASADPRARAAGARRGWRLDHRARQVTAADLEQFDLLVAMDRDNLAALRAFDRGRRFEAKIVLLSEFLPEGAPLDVPDPYYGGAAGFETVLDLLEAACPRLLARLAPPETPP
jgi:protein-tyrosine phosphatase